MYIVYDKIQYDKMCTYMKHNYIKIYISIYEINEYI